MFQGFSQGAIDFLWGIRFNNERGWFLAHKEEFLTLVDAPMRELAAQVSQAMTEEFPKLGLELKVSRIYRDARRPVSYTHLDVYKRQGQSGQQLSVRRASDTASPPLWQGQIGFRRLSKRDRTAQVWRDQVVEVDIGQDGQNQAVHRVEGDVYKRQCHRHTGPRLGRE